MLRALPAGAAPGTLDEGVAAQVEQARRVGALPPAGFKVGATTRGMQAYLGLDGPAARFMAEGGLHGAERTRRGGEHKPVLHDDQAASRLAGSKAASAPSAVTVSPMA